MRTYRITYKTQWQNSWQIFLYLIVAMIAVLYFINRDGISESKLIITVFSIGFLSQLFPQLALHLNYYYTNKGDVLSVDDVHNEIIFTHLDKEVRYNMDDIKSVVEYKSFALKRRDIQYLTYDAYNHAVITLYNGTRIVITSLLWGEYMKQIPFPKEKITVKANVYRWVKGPSLIEGQVAQKMANLKE